MSCWLKIIYSLFWMRIKNPNLTSWEIHRGQYNTPQPGIAMTANMQPQKTCRKPCREPSLTVGNPGSGTRAKYSQIVHKNVAVGRVQNPECHWPSPQDNTGSKSGSDPSETGFRSVLIKWQHPFFLLID